LQLQVNGADKALLAINNAGVNLYWNNLSTILTDNPANGGCFIDNDLTSGTSGKERVLSEADLEAGQPRLRYEFHSTITAADPGAGFIRYNNATPASVTELYLNDTSEHGLNSDRVLNNLADGDILTLGNEVDPADYLVVSVNGAPTDNTGWWTIPVTIIHSGTLPTVFQNLNIDVQWFSQVVAGGSPFATPLVITGDINTATPPTTEAVTARLLATDLAGDDDLFALGFEGDNNLILRSFMHSSTGGFELILENSAGAEANPIDIIGGSNVFMDFQSSSGALGVSATSNILWDTTNAELRRSGNRRIRTASDGMELHGDLSNDPTSGGTQDTHITFMNDIAQVCGDIDWLATTDMHIINRTHGGGFVFRMEDASGGTEVDALTFTEDAGQVLVAQETEVGMTAFATGGQTSATQISSSHSVFSTVATLADSSKLPEVFLVGTKCLIKNDGAADMDVFPFLGDDLGAGTNTAVSVVAGTGALFVATVADATWTQMY
jgi:hypothetical protein